MTLHESLEQITQQTIQLKNDIEKLIIDSFKDCKFDIQKQHHIKEIKFVSYSDNIKTFTVVSSYNNTTSNYLNYSKLPDSIKNICDSLSNKFSQSVYSGFSINLDIYNQDYGWNNQL